jgi:hypothetical protein
MKTKITIYEDRSYTFILKSIFIEIKPYTAFVQQVIN